MSSDSMTSAPAGTLGTRSRRSLGQDHEEDIFLSFDPRIFRRFFGFVRPYKLSLWGSLAAVLLFVASQVSIPVVISHAVNDAVDSGRVFPFDWVIAGFVFLIIANALGSFLQEWTAARLAQQVIFDLRRAMFSHLQDVSMGFLDQTHVGRVMSRLQGDVNALQEFLETSVSAIGDFVLLVGIIVVLLVMNWWLGLLTLSVLPVLIIVRAIWLPRVKSTFRRARDASSIVNGVLAENISGVRTVQEFRREEVNFAYFEQRARENLEAQVNSAWASQIMVPTVDILSGVALAVIAIAGGSAVLNGRLDVGVMIAFIFYAQRFFDPIRTLSQQYTVMQRAMAAGYRIFEVLDVPVAIHDRPDAIDLVDVVPSVEFRNVTFGYKTGRAVLHDLSFAIAPYEKVAIIGPTGSGKTSITALLHRFYDVWQGEILIGGHDVRDVTLDSLGHTVAMVLQEPFLFTGTVLENIRFNTSSATREQVIAAAVAVSADKFISKLPDGYDTQLGQRGQNLSIGQRQLLSFARALVADPKILILDEATANIDSFTELDIQNALNVLLKGRTSIVIAHRLATVRDADRIIVLQDGKIVEQGPHNALLAEDGLYARLLKSSFSSFDEAQPGAG